MTDADSPNLSNPDASGSDPDSDPVPTLAADLNQISDDLRYRQAAEAVDRLIERLERSPRERTGLEADVDRLRGLRQKLTDAVVQIAVFGLVGRGKSSLLNALVGRPVFVTGPLHGVTRQAEQTQWQVETLENGTQQARLSSGGRSRVELVDTPGIDEVDGLQQQDIAQCAAVQADLIVFVAAGDLTQVEYAALQALRRSQKPVLLVFNKVDQYAPADRQQVLAQLRQQAESLGIPSEQVLTAAAAPLVTEVVETNGQRQVRRQRGAAQIDDLRWAMLELLQREGKALVALNSLLYADRLNQQLLERKRQIRRQSAEDAIWQASLTKAIAVAVNPVLVADAIGGAAVDLALIVTLSRLYGLEMSQQAALQLLRTIALATGSLSATELLITFGLGSLKSLLGASAIASGGLTLSPYFAVAVTQAAVAGVSTYMIGQVTQTYLTNDASWGKGGPKAAIANLLETLDKDSILTKIKAELQEQLRPDWAKSKAADRTI